jgi:NADH-quinone oxidoreductase subunit G
MEDKKIIKGKIDGIEVSVPEGTTILNAAKSVGVEIPHFCYHHGIGIEGSCRMCLVEIKGNPKLQISCALPFTTNLEVITDSAAVKKAREAVLEFLLINHPLDCPICDKGGECPLQDYTYKYSVGRSRFDEEKRHLVKHKILSDHIIFDSERCILCTRCARYYRDTVGTHELVVRKRGHKAEIAAFKEKPLANIFSGNLADLCPVGALTTREFRFQARPWEMKTYDSICGICGLQCSAQIWKRTRDRKIMRMTPEYNPKVNDWWLCDRGRFGYVDFLKPERIKSARIKEQEESRDLSAHDALTELTGILGDIFRKNGKECFKIISSCDISNEEGWILREIAQSMEKAGSVIFNIPRNNWEFHRYLESNGLLVSQFGDIGECQNIVLLGTNIIETHPVLYLRLRKLALENSVKIYGVGDFKLSDEKLITKKLAELRAVSSLECTGKTAVFVDESWLAGSKYDSVKELLDELKSQGTLYKVLPLRKDDYNSRGILNIATNNFAFEEEIKSTLGEGAPKVLVLIGDDVIAKVMGNPKFDPARYSFLCLIKKYSDDYVDKAHLVFPQRSFLEKDGTMTGVLGTLQKLSRAHRISDEIAPEWKIFSSFAAALGLQIAFQNESEICNSVLRNTGEQVKDYSKLKNAQDLYVHYNRELRK